ncbi:MAG: hypothetical protein DGJ47_000432 [Rickettsiaceae bacterium]
MNLFTSNTGSNYSEDIISILRLIRSENVGPKTFFNLVKLFGSAKIALDNVADFAKKGGRAKPIKIFAKSAAEKEIDLLVKHGANLITYKDNQYSELLKQTSGFPPILSYKGDISLLNSRKNVAIVGARNSSINSRSFAGNIAKDLVSNDFVTVSGLARGVDTAVHQASTRRTIAVIAGGIDHIYPLENKKLFETIAQEGLIIAELPVGSSPLAQHFPQRNRIIAGMSVATVVIEAGLKSGSLITANFALDFNREVFAVPGFPLDPRCMGSNKLIKDGAYLLESSEDLIENIPSFEKMQKSLFENSDNNNFDFPAGVGNMNIANSDRKLILESLSSSPVSIEQITSETNLPLSVIYVICLELELAGRVMRQAGNKISLIY